MSTEPTYESVVRDTGVDPDLLRFRRIVQTDYSNRLRTPVPETYSGDMELTTVPIPSRTLTAQDRCDRCGARALTVATLDDLELLFCGHHTGDNMAVLESKGWTVSSSDS